MAIGKSEMEGLNKSHKGVDQLQNQTVVEKDLKQESSAPEDRIGVMTEFNGNRTYHISYKDSVFTGIPEELVELLIQHSSQFEKIENTKYSLKFKQSSDDQHKSPTKILMDSLVRIANEEHAGRFVTIGKAGSNENTLSVVLTADPTMSALHSARYTEATGNFVDLPPTSITRDEVKKFNIIYYKGTFTKLTPALINLLVSSGKFIAVPGARYSVKIHEFANADGKEPLQFFKDTLLEIAQNKPEINRVINENVEMNIYKEEGSNDGNLLVALY